MSAARKVVRGQKIVTRAQEEGVKEAVQTAEDSAKFVKGGVAQLLGIKGADAETNKWKIRLQLTKPVTWVPLIWGEASPPPNDVARACIVPCEPHRSSPFVGCAANRICAAVKTPDFCFPGSLWPYG